MMVLRRAISKYLTPLLLKPFLLSQVCTKLYQFKKNQILTLPTADTPPKGTKRKKGKSNGNYGSYDMMDIVTKRSVALDDVQCVAYRLNKATEAKVLKNSIPPLLCLFWFSLVLLCCLYFSNHVNRQYKNN